ncbi:MAG: LptF/LptG family permease [Myxococcota bacterium]
MRSPRTLSRYVIKEVLGYTALGLVSITIVMVTQNLFRFLDEMISASVRLGDFAVITGSLSLMLATYSVPIAFLFGVLLALGRLASDSEITAMNACGVGHQAIWRPMFVLGIGMSVVTGYLFIEAEHVAQLTLRRVVTTMAARGGFIEAGRFRRLGERVLFVREIDANQRLQGVVISDRTDKARGIIIFAESGEVNWKSAEHEVEFRLSNGDIHVEPSENAADAIYQRIGFRSFIYTLDSDSLFGRHFGLLRPREMTRAQLKEIVALAESGKSLSHLRRKDPIKYELQIQRRIALPFAPLIFAFVGAPLGLSRRRGARSWGALLCGALIFTYYAMMIFSEFLAVQRVIPALVALWVPNALFAAAAAFLLYRTRRVRG